MKIKMGFTLLCIICILDAFSQINTYSHTENGMFICKVKHYLICTESEEMYSETPTYTIKAINLNNGTHIMIDKQTINQSISHNDTAILYIKNSNLMLWDFEHNKKNVYYRSNTNLSIIGAIYNKHSSDLLLIQINYKTKELFINILNDRKENIFCEKFEVNEMEMEGVAPILNTNDNFFIFLIQDKLYTVNIRNMELRLISNKCDGYALNSDEIIYYKFVSEEKTEGYSINLITNENKKIDSSLNEYVYNCDKSLLFTANIDDKFIPTYIICNKSYLWINNKWQIDSKVLKYEDSTLIVKIPFEKNTIKDSCFQWKLK